MRTSSLKHALATLATAAPAVTGRMVSTVHTHISRRRAASPQDDASRRAPWSSRARRATLAVIPMLIVVMCGASAAQADFWSDAGSPYKGVTITGVSESTPPSNYVKDVLGDP